jgi:hypothetical protein
MVYKDRIVPAITKERPSKLSYVIRCLYAIVNKIVSHVPEKK